MNRFTEITEPFVPEVYVFQYRTFVPDGRQLYAYVAVNKDKIAAFMQHLKTQETIVLPEYGEILATGFGEPTDEIKRWMEENYAYDHGQALLIQDKRTASDK